MTYSATIYADTYDEAFFTVYHSYLKYSIMNNYITIITLLLAGEKS